MNPLTRNVTNVFRTATPADIEAGAAWYRDAHEVARAMGIAYGTSVETATGILAALSPLNSWGNNVNLAHRLMVAGGLESGYLRANLAKANAILAGADPLTTLGGEKVLNFYRSILTQGRDGVCIDRHAYCIAVNARVEATNLKGRHYAEVVECYRRAARILSKEYGQELTPAMVQSVTWVLWRRRYWAEGAHDVSQAG